MNYYELYQRNLGIFTEEEQEKLQRAQVFIAGAGGTGGPLSSKWRKIMVIFIIVTLIFVPTCAQHKPTLMYL